MNFERRAGGAVYRGLQLEAGCKAFVPGNADDDRCQYSRGSLTPVLARRS